MNIRLIIVLTFGLILYAGLLPGPLELNEAQACHLLCGGSEPEEEEEERKRQKCKRKTPCGCRKPPNSQGQPVSLLDGSELHVANDVYAGSIFPIVITRSYDSLSDFDTALGLGWAFQHDRRLFQYPDGSVIIRSECGIRTRFVQTGGAYVTPLDGPQGELIEHTDGSFEFRYYDGTRDFFDADGRLVAEVSREGHRHEFLYDPRGRLPLTGISAYAVDPSQPMVVAYQPRLTRIQERTADGQLTGIFVEFFYDETTGRLQRLETHDGREVFYTHDETPDGLTHGKLLTVHGLDNMFYAYGYDDPNDPRWITSIQEGQNGEPVVNEYNADGWIIRQTHGAQVLEFDYEEPEVRTHVTRKIYDDQDQLLHTAVTTVEFDQNGYVSKQVDPLGHETRYFYDGNEDMVRQEWLENRPGGLVLSRATDYTHNAQGQVLSASTTLDSGVTETITESWTYDHGRVTSEQTRSDADPGKIFRTEYTFFRDADNRPTNIHEIKRRNDDGSFSVTTYEYCDANDVTKPGSTCPFGGLIKSIDGSRTDITDITTYAYYPDTDLSGCDSGGTCHRKGDLHTITNALGHVTEFIRYDLAGRVVAMQDANGIVTEMTYHARGWLLSRTVKGPVGSADATTSYAYDGRGNSTRVTLPDGSFIDYTYDGRNRLTEVADNLGNRIEYVLDSEGNRLAEHTYDPQDTLTRIMRMEYDAVSQLKASLNAQNQITSYTYDDRSNRLTSIDPKGVETQEEYDALGQLIRTVQDVGGIEAEAHFSYDAAGNLVKVIDPNGLSTVYEFDTRDNLLALASPDTGTIIYSYDAADNRIYQMDARGAEVVYEYDAMNRLTATEYKRDSSLDVTYSYDEDNSVTGCTDSYFVGRLTRMQDSTGTTTYCYDHRGNTTHKIWYSSAGRVSLALNYEYDVADRLTAIIYPSGRRVEYPRDEAGRLAGIDTEIGGQSQPVLSSVDYLPLGPVTAYQFGNKQAMTRSYDQNYWLTGVQSPALQLHVQRDAVGNIDRFGPAPGAEPPLEHYGYDNLYRLQTVRDDQSMLVEGYTYDATGNRQTKQQPGATQVYNYSPFFNHRLISVDGQARTYDAVGNTLTDADGNKEYTYGDHNRLTSFVGQNNSASYLYNGRGERVRKTATVDGETTGELFVYDEAGRLLGEYDNIFGMVLQEYVYADDIPVAVIKKDEIYNIHADHLGTPRTVTDNSGTKRWEWQFQSNPFGEMLPDEDPEITGTDFTLNLRFPGQYYDAESGLHYNYFRDYEADTGRYMQADPLGLLGGISSYSYVSHRPMTLIDPLGLFGECPYERPPPNCWFNPQGTSIYEPLEERRSREINRRKYTICAPIGLDFKYRGRRAPPLPSLTVLCRKRTVTTDKVEQLNAVSRYGTLNCLDDCGEPMDPIFGSRLTGCEWREDGHRIHTETCWYLVDSDRGLSNYGCKHRHYRK